MKRKSLALLMAAITVFSAVGCGSKDAAADTTTAEPAAEETTEASDAAAAADTASDARWLLCWKNGRDDRTVGSRRRS